ncbi:DUF1501 domain-containing protein [Humisphaera borealis]|uniref:DUF1501 domain-containing protein n=1 Tax=Humisphaera borealis TaxID=2807512 RepID=A0A7M2WRI1_9BACT|nr:DUF1501 domain-containing protein [Humisphaera borealis]QOV88137.1 DUF1501 domain-containing protein [Humisphaera borealis]
MLTIFGKRASFCDGISRRNFLKIGAFGLGASQLTLPQLLRAEAAQGISRNHKALIMVYLPGGPSHQDMYDLKTDAPADIRGDFKPINTNVNGIQLCEHLPRLAGIMDKLAVIRSVVGSEGQHGSFQCLTGRSKRPVMPPGGWPTAGAILSKVYGAANRSMPPYVTLSGDNMRGGEAYGYLGVSHSPFSPSGQGRRDMTLNGVTLDRLEDRKSLLGSLDKMKAEYDNSGQMEGSDAFNHMAMDMLTSTRVAEALDVKKEDPRVLERYRSAAKDDRGSMDSFCVARRLVEAGARCVTLSYGGWDTHSDNFKSMAKRLPGLDAGVSSLVTDLYERGMDKDVAVVVWGEFGRTPKINAKAGRDHWPRVCGALVAGGGMKMGQAIGKTDRLGGEAADRPVHFAEVFATLYTKLGIDTSKVTLKDLSGRPQYVVDQAYQPMRELV